MSAYDDRNELMNNTAEALAQVCPHLTGLNG